MPIQGCLPQMPISGELCPRIKTNSEALTGKAMDLSWPDVQLSNKVSNRTSCKKWDAIEIREGNKGVNGLNLEASSPPILLSPITDSGFNSTSNSPSWANVVRLSEIIDSPTRKIPAKIGAQWKDSFDPDGPIHVNSYLKGDENLPQHKVKLVQNRMKKKPRSPQKGSPAKLWVKKR